jgi:hypothetical protein
MKLMKTVFPTITIQASLLAVIVISCVTHASGQG